MSSIRPSVLALAVALGGCSSVDPKSRAHEADGATASSSVSAPLPAAPVARGGILKSLRASHPRLLLTAASLADLKKKITADPLAKAWAETITAQGEKLLETPDLGAKFPAAGNKGRVVADRLYLLGMLYRLAPDRAAAERWAKRADDELLAVSKMTWSESSFLQLAEFANGVAVGYDWAYDALTPATRAAVVRALHEKAIAPATLAYRKTSSGSVQSWWRDSSSNWNLVSNSGVVLAALAIAGDDADPKHLADIEDVLERALVSLDKGLPSSVSYGLAGYGSDGAWAEGPDYWNYATRYLVTMLEALDTALGEDFGVWHAKKGLEATGFFPKYFTGPIGLTFNYADCNESGDENGAEASPFLFRLARRYDQPLFADIEARRLRAEEAHHRIGDRPYNLVLDLLWMEPPSRKPAEPPLDARFQDQGLAFLRQSWSDSGSLALAIKGGVAFGPHHHADLGSFVLDADGVRWVVDLGKDNYSLKDYGHHDKTFWYRQKTEGHNTLVFDGQNQEERESINAPIEKWAVNRAEGPSFGTIDLSRPYASEAARVTRGFALDRSRKLVLLRDEIEPRASRHAKKLKWTIHTRSDVTVEPGGNVALLSSKRGSATVKMKLVILEPPAHGVRFESAPAPAATGLEESRAGIQVVSITVDASRSADIVVAFVPESSPDFHLDGPALAKSLARSSPLLLEPIQKWR